MRKKILIVDDEIAHSGKDALDRINKNIPDLIILDILMPDMSGNEVAETLKDRKAWARIPIIFLSALLSKEDEKAKNPHLTVNHIVSKPYEIKDLVSRINTVLGAS